MKIRTTTDYKVNDNSVIAFVKIEKTDKVSMRNLNCSPELYREYKGIARYKEGDTNDMELAADIARRKALRNLYKNLKNYLTLSMEIKEREMREQEELIAALSDRVKNLNNEIEKITK